MSFKSLSRSFVVVAFLAAFSCLAGPAAAQEIEPSRTYRPLELKQDAQLARVLRSAVDAVLEEFKEKGLSEQEIAATVIDLSREGTASVASFRGDSRIYPASVVKMFFMAALEQQLEDGKVRLTPELKRGESDMIVDSSNEATQYILDVLTVRRVAVQTESCEPIFHKDGLYEHQRKSEDIL
jgi:beta-lactamase class A